MLLWHFVVAVTLCVGGGRAVVHDMFVHASLSCFFIVSAIESVDVCVVDWCTYESCYCDCCFTSSTG